ncbi:MAG: carboxymuconolactone decarboxylase family protein [Spirochaetales bacterium]|nr:carboxymuconolactone decarboxylase family protein [Spirochaetales bacterium]
MNNVKLKEKMKLLLLFSILSVFLASCASSGSSSDAGFREVRGTTLAAREQSIVSIAAFTAVGDLDELSSAIAGGLDNGLTVNEIGEVLLQSYAYAGFPRALNGTATLAAVLEERQSAGIRDPYGVEPGFITPGADKYELGVANLGTLMGFPLAQQKAASNGYNEAMDAFLKEHLFADIFERDTISFVDRELTTVAILASQEGTESQLFFHISAAMNVGVTDEQMENLIEIIGVKISSERADAAAGVLEQIVAMRNSDSPRPASSGDGYSYIPEVFPKGRLNPNADIFTGNAYVAPLVAPDQAGGNFVVNVTFEPGTRTTWHAHSYVQVLFVNMGQGYYEAEGEEPRQLKAGDTVVIPAGVKHWHGSAPGQWFAHIAMIIPVDSGEEDLWLGDVDQEYYSGLN